MRVAQSIPNLVQGVSQQPASLRRNTQAEAQDNSFPSVSQGQVKRPPSEYLAKVSSSDFSSAFVHTINRDNDEQYIVIISNGDLRVFDLSGVEKTVSFPDGKTYLTSTSPRSGFKAVTVADYTFIVNKNVEVAKTTSTNGKSLTGKAQRFSALPDSASIGQVYEIIGDDSTGFDNYFVEYTSTDIWEETVEPGNEWELDASTLPYTLISNADGTFSFEQATWEKRLAGDSDSNPDPSFVGRAIADVFFYKNRLGFLSDEAVILSEAGEFFNFFRTTVTTLLDSAPIDVTVSHVKVSILRNALPFSKNLIVFSDNTQFKIAGDDILSPKTIAITPLTEYENNAAVMPVGLGKTIFFPVEKGVYSSILEYYLTDESGIELTDASEITEHAPKYIPGGVFKLAGSSTHSSLVALTEQAPNCIYFYKFFWQGDEKLQSSWCRWVFSEDDSILNADFIKNKLILLVQRVDGVYLESIDFDIEDTDTNTPYKARLDRRVSDAQCSVSYDAETNKTTWTLPYEYSGDMVIVTRYGESSSYPPGVVIKNTRGDDDEILATGDFTSVPVYIGIKYSHLHEFSQLTIKDQAPGGGSSTVAEGRLMLQYMTVLYDKTGYFKARVTPAVGSSYEYSFTGRIIGVQTSSINSPSLESGKFRFPIKADASRVKIELINDTFLPSVFNSAEWEGRYTSKAKRI